VYAVIEIKWGGRAGRVGSLGGRAASAAALSLDVKSVGELDSFSPGLKICP